MNGNDYIEKIEEYYEEILRNFLEQNLTQLELIDYLVKGENIEHIKTDYNEEFEEFAEEWVEGYEEDNAREMYIEDRLLEKYEE